MMTCFFYYFVLQSFDSHVASISFSSAYLSSSALLFQYLYFLTQGLTAVIPVEFVHVEMTRCLKVVNQIGNF